MITMFVAFASTQFVQRIFVMKKRLYKRKMETTAAAEAATSVEMRMIGTLKKNEAIATAG